MLNSLLIAKLNEYFTYKIIFLNTIHKLQIIQNTDARIVSMKIRAGHIQ